MVFLYDWNVRNINYIKSYVMQINHFRYTGKPVRHLENSSDNRMN